jgi:hypothetical protein
MNSKNDEDKKIKYKNYIFITDTLEKTLSRNGETRFIF